MISSIVIYYIVYLFLVITVWINKHAVQAMGTRSELEQLQHQANKVTDDSLESTRRMLSLCEEVSPVTVMAT
jgi:hypothetical protein